MRFLILILSVFLTFSVSAQTKINPAKLIQGALGSGSMFLKTDNSGNVSYSNNLNGAVLSGIGNGTLSGDAAAFNQIAAAVNAAVSGTQGYHARFSAANVLGNSIMYETGGSIGISSANIYGLFTVGGAAYINGASTGSTTFLGFKNNTTDIAYLGSDNGINAGAGADFNAYVYGNNNLFLSTNGVKRLTINGAGTATFSGNVTVPTGTISAHAINLAQLTSAIAGTTHSIPKFTSANTIGSSVITNLSSDVQFQYLSQGYTKLSAPGSNTLTGSLAFFLGDNTRLGYIGSHGSKMLYIAEGASAGHLFQGGNLDVSGNKIVNIQNGTTSSDAASFGQIVTAVNTAVSGSSNYVPRFTSTNTIGNSNIHDNGTNVGIGYTSAVGRLDVSGSGAVGTRAANFNGNHITIGDANGGALNFAGKGIGIKFYDSGVAHYTMGMLDNVFKISSTSSSGDELYPASRSDWLSIDGSSGLSTFLGYVVVPNAVSATHALNIQTADTRYAQLGTSNNWGNTTQTALTFSTAGTGAGSINIIRGDATFSGLLQVLTPNGNRALYIGYASNGGAIQYGAENGSYHNFSGGRIVNDTYIQAPRFVSSAATGTQPYQTTSTTLNANLNANFVQGLDSSILAQRTQKNSFTQQNSFAGTTLFSGLVNISAALRSDYTDGANNLLYGDANNDVKYTTYQSVLNRTQANDTFAMTTSNPVFTLSSNQVSTVDIGVYTNVIDSIDIRLAAGVYDDNQVISITTNGKLIAGNGDKIKVTSSTGVTLIEIYNDVLSMSNYIYEMATTSLGLINLQIQYSKKRAKWRIIGFRTWD